MRIVSMVALAVAGAMAVPGVASAAPVPESPAHSVAVAKAAEVLLPTGDVVRLKSGPGGRTQVLTQPAFASGPGSRLTTNRFGSDVYVLPAAVKPYLGSRLDPALFDVTRRAAAGSDRIAVRIAYTGAAPAAPGLVVTSARAGAATGYLTKASAVTFGAALARQFAADAKAGFPARASLFTGITKLTADLPGTGVVTPSYPMKTLILRALDAAGKPATNGFGFLLNVDDGRYGNFLQFVGGQARVSVPTGTYSLVYDSFAYDEATDVFSDRMVTVNEYEVTTGAQTLTVDARTATLKPSVTVPKATKPGTYTFEWDRTDAKRNSGIAYQVGAGPKDDLLIAPAGPVRVGILGTVQTWNLDGPGATPAYTYTVASGARRIPASLALAFTAADLATVKDVFSTDGRSLVAGLLRFPVYPFQFFVGGFFADVQTPATVTSYVGATGDDVDWGTAVLLNYQAPDPAEFDSDWAPIPAGTTAHESWGKGPLVPGFARQPADSGSCWACRFGDTISVGLVNVLDADPDHYGYVYGDESGEPIARFRFYRDGVLLSDQADYLGGEFDVPAGAATYRAVLDLDRRLTKWRQSTSSTTELTFSSKAGAGAPLPDGWYCDFDQEDQSACRVLPVIDARLSLPTSLRGTLPAAKSTVGLTVGRIQNAGPATIVSASLQIRPQGGAWRSVPVTATGAGTYTASVDNTGLAGQNVDVRFGGRDATGSSFLQTDLAAYTVAGS